MCVLGLMLRSAPSVRKDLDKMSTCPKMHPESEALYVCKGGKNKLLKIQEDISGKQRLDEDSPVGNKADSEGSRVLKKEDRVALPSSLIR